MDHNIMNFFSYIYRIQLLYFFSLTFTEFNFSFILVVYLVYYKCSLCYIINTLCQCSQNAGNLIQIII